MKKYIGLALIIIGVVWFASRAKASGGAFVRVVEVSLTGPTQVYDTDKVMGFSCNEHTCYALVKGVATGY
jgi:hypothetical protein